MTRYIIHFTGRVQGVGFRYQAKQLAKSHDIAGLVENLPDGRVRLVVEGEHAALDNYLKTLVAQMGGHIHEQNVREEPATGEFGPPKDREFFIRR